jgi:recombination protein RecT
MTHAYSVGRVRGAEFPVIEVWPVAKIIRHRDRFNKVGGDHYSFQHQEMYSRKIPLLQVLKYMPSSIELSMAQEFEQVAESGAAPIDLQQAIDGTFMAPPDGATETEGGSADSNSGASIPHYDEKAAIEQIRKATTLDILEGVWKAVRNDFTNSSRSLPIGVEAAYNDRKAALEPKG